MSSLSCLVLLFCIASVLLKEHVLSMAAPTRTRVYIVYMSKKQHDDPELLTTIHHETLASVLGSKEESSESMIYSYKHGFSGFAARLTAAQAQKLADLPTVAKVIPNHFFKTQTTRSWDYLQLSSQAPNTLQQQAKMGEGVIIGLLDSGIWPESKVFNDEGLGPIPSRWNGVCETGESFDGAKSCNRKVVGARYFIEGLLAEYGKPFNPTENRDYLSPRDAGGHGTHTSSTAAGSFVSNVSYNGLGIGTVRGGAPQARVAMYKVCWQLNPDDGVCAAPDILKAFDEAIHDGVDVISVSIAAELPVESDVDVNNGLTVGAFHAAAKGIIVVTSAGNDGPQSQTIQNPAPWVLTVAASSIDRSFPTPITLGNNWTTMGQGMFPGMDTGFVSLVYPEVSDLSYPRNKQLINLTPEKNCTLEILWLNCSKDLNSAKNYCNSLSQNDTWAAKNIVLCFDLSSWDETMDVASSIEQAGGLGLIVVKYPNDEPRFCGYNFPCVQVSFEAGLQILYYIRSTSHPQVWIRPSKTHIGKPVPTKVAYFSSRGPNTIAPAILKPDIAAPGVCILAAVIPKSSKEDSAFAFMSGTSMATPHVSGVVALLKAQHPHWSPAAIKSAIITTAWTTAPSGEPIFAEGEPKKLADPFDFGGGIINPNRASDPGLVYDMGIPDYIHYLCAMDYGNSMISHLIEAPTTCSNERNSILNINLPSITIPMLNKWTTVTRSVTNVGAVNSRYKAVVNPPFGITIKVVPEILIFNSEVKTITFTVAISSGYRVSTGYFFGSLTWKNAEHAVRIPISVRTQITEPYY